jgi:GntR family transcriptional regulator/MocR family aminotransferase
LGYIVAPRALIAELRVLRHAMVRHPSAFLQHAFAHFLSLGHHETHARRVNQALQARMHALSEALCRELPDFRFALPTGGASVWVRAPDWVDTGELARMARQQGVLIEAGEVFFMHPPYPCPYFRLRLSSIGVDQIGLGSPFAGSGARRTQSPGTPALICHNFALEKTQGKAYILPFQGTRRRSTARMSRSKP